MIATILLLASLGIDTFGVAVGLGLSGLPRHRWWRVALLFATFETGMPIVGLVVGRKAASIVGTYSVIGAAILLILLGAWELRELYQRDDKDDEGDPQATRELDGSRGSAKWLLVGLSISMDEFAVGFTLGILPFPLIIAFTWIAIQTVAVTLGGLWFGVRLGRQFEDYSERAAGMIWILVGVSLIVETALGR